MYPSRDVHRRMARIFEVNREQLIADVRKLHPDLEETSPREFKIVPVKSYVGDMKIADSGTFRGIVVPPFATHWGIAVEDTLYHLTFRNPDHARIELTDFARHGKPIRFTATVYDDGSFDHCPVVGQAKYSHEARVKIGKALIKAFGNYHRLFWNCQVFAQIFLYFIIGNHSFAE